MFQVVDSRQAEADRAWDRWVQRGVPPKVVKEILPALVSSKFEVSQRAEAWLAQATVGHDNDAAALARDNRLANAARQFVQGEMERGSFAGEPAYKVGSRYGASDADLDAELDRQSSGLRYPGSAGNAQRLTLSELEAQAQTRHRRHDLTLHEDGRLTTPTGEVVETLDVPQFGPAPLSLRDTSPTHPNADLSNGDGTTHYSRASADEDYWQQGANTPFWA